MSSSLEGRNQGVFISYRRGDGEYIAGRIYDSIKSRFSDEVIFRDIDNIPLGSDFFEVIGRAVQNSSVLVVVIGRDWVERLPNESDFVRLEVESALRLQIPIIPVFIDGAKAPIPEELPESVRSITRRNGIPIRPDPDFHSDIDRLCLALKDLLCDADTEFRRKLDPDSDEGIGKCLNTLETGRGTLFQPWARCVLAIVGIITAIGFVVFFDRPNDFSVDQIGDQSVFQDLEIDGIPLVINAEAGDSAEFSVLVSAENSELIPPENILIARNDSGSRRLSITPANGRSGDTEIQIVVERGEKVVELSFRIRVIAPPFPLVRVLPGEFIMGSSGSDEKREDVETPSKLVSLTRPFWIGTFEITQQVYQQVVGRNPSKFNGGQYGVDLRRPVENVSWHAAIDFCADLTARERREGRLPSGYVYRLPTEAEWEYACRASTRSRFSFGNDVEKLDEYAWYDQNSSGQTWAVGSKKPNPWNLFDIHGNVWEWCYDWSAAYEEGNPENPSGPQDGKYRAIRGGSIASSRYRTRSACRDKLVPGLAKDFIGFRVVLASELPREVK